MENMEQNHPEPEVISASSLELIQRAEIDMQIATARRYPRDLALVKKRMMSFATLDEETAESCFYTLPRDGKTIQGPSVRLAEIAVACYQNIRAASRVIDNNGKTITSQAACHDLENNTLISVEVQRRITNKKGQTYSEDMQVTAGNAANAIAFRNAVFKVIPGALVKPVYEQAKLVAVGNASTLIIKRDKMIKRLNAMHVTTDRILAKLEKSNVENLGLEDLEILIGLGTAIKDGDTSVDEAFPPIAQPGKQNTESTEQREARLEKQMADQAEEPKSQTQPEPETPKSERLDTAAAQLGFWPDRPTMIAAFQSIAQILGEDVIVAKMADNGIASVDDLSIMDQATFKAFNELSKAAQLKKAEEEPKQKYQFGKKGK